MSANKSGPTASDVAADLATKIVKNKRLSPSVFDAPVEGGCPTTDTYSIGTIVVGHSADATDYDVIPAVLIEALASLAVRTIFLFVKDLNPLTYGTIEVIDALQSAIARGAKIWILASDHVDDSNHSLCLALSEFIGHSLFIGRYPGKDLNPEVLHLNVKKCNFALVDGVYIRFEENMNGASAFGVKHIDAGALLTVVFRALWSASTGLHGPYDAVLHAERVHIEYKSDDVLVSFDRIRCVEYPGVKVDLLNSAADQDVDLAVVELCALLSAGISSLAEDKKVCYGQHEKTSEGKYSIALTRSSHLSHGPGSLLNHGV